MRRIHRERALLVGGGRALVMQLAHPAVAAGVAEHSDFPQRALVRLRRTLDLSLAVVYGSQGEAQAAAERIRAVHDRVRGSLDGVDYRATDPALLLWVHATLIDSTLEVYARFVGPIPSAARRRYYEETKVSAGLLGIPDDVLPADLDAFEAYLRGMLAGDELRATPSGQRLVSGVLRPPVPMALRPAAAVARLITLQLLPGPIRDLFHLRVGPGSRLLTGLAEGSSRLLLPVIPARVRTFAASRV